MASDHEQDRARIQKRPERSKKVPAVLAALAIGIGGTFVGVGGYIVGRGDRFVTKSQTDLRLSPKERKQYKKFVKEKQAVLLSSEKTEAIKLGKILVDKYEKSPDKNAKGTEQKKNGFYGLASAKWMGHGNRSGSSFAARYYGEGSGSDDTGLYIGSFVDDIAGNVDLLFDVKPGNPIYNQDPRKTDLKTVRDSLNDPSTLTLKLESLSYGRNGEFIWAMPSQTTASAKVVGNKNSEPFTPWVGVSDSDGPFMPENYKNLNTVELLDNTQDSLQELRSLLAGRIALSKMG